MRTPGPASPDGHLAHHVEGNGQVALFYRHNQLGNERSERVLAGGEQILWLGRSVFGQVGGDIQADGEAVSDNGGIYVPITFNTYAPVCEALVDDIKNLTDTAQPGETLKWEGSELPGGRFVDLSKLEKLEPDEVESAIRDSLISFGPERSGKKRWRHYRFDENGTLTVRLSKLEFIISEEHFLEKIANRMELLRGGRAVVARESDHVYKKASDEVPDFLLGGIRISPGPLYWRIVNQAGALVAQLESASFFDANRLPGIGKRLSQYDKNRQVELRRIYANMGDEPPTFGDTWLPLEFYRSAEVGQASHARINWTRLSPQQRIRIHERGITPLEAMETADTANHTALLAAAKQAGVGALVLTKRGARTISDTGSLKLNARRVVEALDQGFDGIQPGLENLAPLIEDLQMAGEHTTTTVMARSRLEDLQYLRESGDVRAFLSEDYNPGRGEVLNSLEHAQLVNHSRQGVGIAWYQPGDYREFHPNGMWLKPGIAERLENQRLSVAIFGAHRPEVGKLLQQDIAGLLGRLVILVGGSEYLSVVHGGGDGVMRIADLEARRLGSTSLSFGIDVEQIGQNAINRLPDGRMNLFATDVSVRQHFLEAFSTIPINTKGRYGTVLEQWLSLTVRKLLQCLPTPVIVVDPENIYRGTRQQVEDFATPTKGQRNTDLKPSEYMANLYKTVSNFENGAYEVVKRFYEDPPRAWYEANVPRADIKKAGNNHEAQLEHLGMPMAPFLKDAWRSY